MPHRGARIPQAVAWQDGKMVEIIRKINEITHRLEEYHKHSNDPYTYFPEEVDAVRNLKMHAAEDIEFLLNEIKK